MNKILRPFKFGAMQSVKDFEDAMRAEGIDLPCQEDVSALKQSVRIGDRDIPNRLAIHPCEGFDGFTDGKPSPRIFRRYGRYARGGAGMIWFEAISVCEDGICNPHQLIINDDNLEALRRLVAHTDEEAMKAWGRKPYKVIQLTHSGRSAVDRDWNPRPLIAFENPHIDRFYRNITVASDARIEELEQQMIHAAWLAAEAGFDAVDIKLCHNYIMRELLSAFTRPGKYGGSFENRTRFVRNVVAGIREKCGDRIALASRLNAYDCLPYPYGWGMVQQEGVMQYDLTEPIQLMKMLAKEGMRLFNISTMMPRYSPLDTGYVDHYEGKAVLNPYQSTATLLKATRELKQAVPDAVLVATGLSWFNRFGANVGAGGVQQGWFDIAGFGRQAFAYPDFARDILEKGEMVGRKCCVNCDKCYDLIDFHENSGCVVRDSEEYLPLYQRGYARSQG